MKKNKSQIIPNNSFTEFLLYTTPNGKVKVEIFLRDENIWLSQDKIALLFGVDRTVVTKHMRNIFNANELLEDSVCAKIAHTADDGKTYKTKFYNLDAIISVGYRVNSTQATHFRIWAISRQTAAEIIYSRADSQKQNMGLTSWKNSPKGQIRKNDVSIAKNYLNKNELDNLNLMVTMYLDYAELQANNRIIMTMKDWIAKLDAFLKFNEKDILANSGKVTAEIAKSFAESEFEKFKVIQDKLYQSDFDIHIKNQLHRGKDV